jgi:hypothetical protein
MPIFNELPSSWWSPKIGHCLCLPGFIIILLREALTGICFLPLFPLVHGTPTYESWEVCLKERTGYVQHHTATTHPSSHPSAHGMGITIVLYGRATIVTANHGTAGLAEVNPARPMAGAPRPAALAPAPSQRATAAEAPAQPAAGGMAFTLLRREEPHTLKVDWP